jgi:hypothetical protein
MARETPRSPTPPDKAVEVCAARPDEDRDKGDANGDGAMDLADAAWIRAAMFAGGDDVVCLGAVDLMDDDRLNADDAWLLLMYLFEGSFTLADASARGCEDSPLPETDVCGAPTFSLRADGNTVVVSLDPGGLAVEGWSFALTGGCVTDVTVDGTASASLYTDAAGQRNERYQASFTEDGVATSAALLSLYDRVALAGTADVLVATLAADACSTCTVTLGEAAATYGEPVETVVVADGFRYAPPEVSIEVEVCP